MGPLSIFSLIIAYSGLLTSSLTSPVAYPPLQSFAQLASSDSYMARIGMLGLFWRIIKDSKDPTYAALADKVRRQGYQATHLMILRDASSFVSSSEENYAIVADRSYLQSKVDLEYTSFAGEEMIFTGNSSSTVQL